MPPTRLSTVKNNTHTTPPPTRPDTKIYLPLRFLIIIIVRPRLEVPVERLEPREVRLELAQLRVRGLAERVAVAPEDRQIRRRRLGPRRLQERLDAAARAPRGR